MKIAVFHLGFFYSGGGEKLVLEQVKGLLTRGHKVTCFTPVLDSKACFPEIIGNFEIKPLVFRFPSWVPDWQMLQVFLSCVLFPFFLNRFKGFDVVLAANQPSVFFGWCLKKRWGIPYVSYLAQPTRHLYPRQIDLFTNFELVGGKNALLIANMFRAPIKKLDFLTIRQCDSLLTNGDYIGEVIAGIYKRPYVCCSAGAWPTNSLTDRSGRGNYLLITNRHFPQKRFEYGLQVIKLLENCFPELRLVITGNPTSYTEYLKLLANKLGIASKIVFTGLVGEEELLKLYGNALVYLYTAPQEDFGMGVVEAMISGTPVVAWNEGGPSRTIINSETGFLAQPWRVADFADKTRELLLLRDDCYLNICHQARSHAENNYSYFRHHEIVEKSLKDAVAAKR